MCWSGEASAAIATLGFTSTIYFYYKNESKVLCIALAYFSLMEALQAYTYTVIGQCSNPANQIATLLGYLHISFQPFFINAVSLYFVPDKIRKKISGFIYFCCAITAIIFLIRIYPFEWAQYCYEMVYHITFCKDCYVSMPFCGERICSVPGEWHIAWEIPALSSIAMSNSYLIVAFILPILYGSWRMTIYHIVTGPYLAYLTTNNANEWAAVWCLYSIGLLILMIKTPIRKHLHVKRWFWWPMIR